MRQRLTRFGSIAVLMTLSLILLTSQARQSFALDDPEPDLIETEWVGPDGEFVTTFRFEKGGVLAYSYNGSSYRNGTWKLSGTNLSFELNDGYRTFKGQVKGSTIEGDSSNVAEKKWKTTLYQYTKPK
jgi:predicted dehydrogenase